MNGIGIDVAAGASLTPAPAPRGADAFASLESDDFLKLLITQLTTQDPLEPTGNEELLRQIASIREIELSTSLTESLGKLSGQQRFGSASALIGRYVTGLPEGDGSSISGIVVGVRFGSDGNPLLLLSNGSEIPLDRVSTIEPRQQAGAALVGQTIVGVDRRDSANPKLVEGVVTGVRIENESDVMLELDTGEELRLQDYSGSASAAA